MISVDGLRFDYPGTRALDGISFHMEAGGVTALVGPNGAGKTTLLRCLAALEEPAAGTTRIDGIDTADHPRAAHERIGFLPDHFGVYDALSARQCLLHAGCARGLSQQQAAKRTDNAAREVGLADRLNHRAGTLSRGQRQRLAIAQAIVHHPRVLLLDEPASGLDPEARADLARLLRHLADQGMTIVVSSHILAELETYCTAMLVLRAGRVVEHRRLSQQQADSHTMRLCLSDTAAVASAHEFLATQAQVTALDGDGAMLHFTLSGDETTQTALLRALIEHKLPISAFAPAAAAGMQDAYLNAVGNTDSA